MNHRAKTILAWLLAALILALAAYLRLANLRQSPGWYSDEGVFIDLARNLSNGHWLIFGIKLSPLGVQRPPLYLFTLAAIFHFWGADILQLRLVSALCGTLNVLLLFAFVRPTLGNRLALLSAGILAIAPWIVSFNRLGFSYNLMAPFFLIAIFSVYRFTLKGEVRWGILASLAAALAICVDYLGIVAIGIVLGVCLLYRRRWLPWAILCMALVIAAIILPPVLSDLQGSLQSTQFITGTKVAASPLMQLVNLIVYYGETLLWNGWVLLAFIGLFLIAEPRLRGILLSAAGASFLLTIRTFSPTGRGLHYLIDIFPFLALGLAILLNAAYEKAHPLFLELFTVIQRQVPWLARTRTRRSAWQWVQRIGAASLLVIVLANPLLWMFFVDLSQSAYMADYLFTGVNDIGLTQAVEAESVRNFLSSHSSPTDLVLASPQILWMLPNRQADWGESAACTLKKPECANSLYDCSFSKIRFVVIDPLAQDFVSKLDPDMKKLVDDAEKWPLVYQTEHLSIHENPLHP